VNIIEQAARRLEELRRSGVEVPERAKPGDAAGAKGLPANNALLWGARGMGKSSLVKAAHAGVNAVARNTRGSPLKLIEIHREDIDSLPALMTLTRGSPHRFIVFCDDLSFDAEDTTYKSLKAMLEGGIEGRPDNVIFYATSNRRHLMSRDMMENERSTAINPGEAVEEKVSLSDRFGLWLGFHRCSQDEYLAMVDGYVAYYKIPAGGEALHREALEWSTTRGSRCSTATAPSSSCPRAERASAWSSSRPCGWQRPASAPSARRLR